MLHRNRTPDLIGFLLCHHKPNSYWWRCRWNFTALFSTLIPQWIKHLDLWKKQICFICIFYQKLLHRIWTVVIIMMIITIIVTKWYKENPCLCKICLIGKRLNYKCKPWCLGHDRVRRTPACGTLPCPSSSRPQPRELHGCLSLAPVDSWNQDRKGPWSDLHVSITCHEWCAWGEITRDTGNGESTNVTIV